MPSRYSLDSSPWHSEHGSQPPTTKFIQSSTVPPAYSFPDRRPRGRGFPVLYNGLYIHNLPTIFTLYPSAKRHGRCFQVQNRRKETVYQITSKSPSLRETKVLTQYYHRKTPILRLQQLLFSARSTTIISDDDNDTLLILQKASFTCSYPNVYVFIKNKRSTHDLIVEAQQDGRRFVFRDKATNCVVIGRRFRTTKRGHKPRKYAYTIRIAPGYDTALFIMAAAALFDIWQE